jgi:hypothetical protein
MIKSTLTLGEIYTLEAELVGQTSQQPGGKDMKGLISQPVSFSQKYWLTDLAESLAKDKKNVDTLRNELIQKLGTPGENGSISIPISIDKTDDEGNVVNGEDGKPLKVINPKFQEFNKAMEEIFSQVRDVEHYPFKLEDFDFKSDETYLTFFKLLKPKKDTEQTK